jgi:carbamoyl-phosphate synthase large subunit
MTVIKSMGKTRILISAGGTATAWHLSKLIKENFKEYFSLYVCDTNPKNLVASAVLSDHFEQVPPVMSPGYKEYMLDLFSKLKIDIFVPLIDHDLHIFPNDDFDLLQQSVVSTGISKDASKLLKSKATWTTFLQENGIPVPKTFKELNLNYNTFVVKPVQGFGSRGVSKVDRESVLPYLNDDRFLVQEVCSGPEVTVEVYQHNNVIRTLCRERVETKSGVCTKARIWFDEELHRLAEKISQAIQLPVAFCFQVMKNENKEWVVIDLNPRLGAGTSMATTYGWSLASAFLITHGKLKLNPLDYLRYHETERYVLRVYEDLLVD